MIFIFVLETRQKYYISQPLYAMYCPGTIRCLSFKTIMLNCIAFDKMYLVHDYLMPEGWSLPEPFSSPVPLFLHWRFNKEGLRVLLFFFPVPGPHLHRSTCTLTCSYLGASAQSEKKPTRRGPSRSSSLNYQQVGPATDLLCFCKWGPAWSSTLPSQVAFMAIGAEIWNNALDWQTSPPACPCLTSRGGCQFRLFSSAPKAAGLPAPDSEIPPPLPREPPG